MSSIIPYNAANLPVNPESQISETKKVNARSSSTKSKNKRIKTDIDTLIKNQVDRMAQSSKAREPRFLQLRKWYELSGLPIPQGLTGPVPLNAQYTFAGDNLLHLALRMNSLTLVKLLIQKGTPKLYEMNIHDSSYSLAAGLFGTTRNNILDVIESAPFEPEKLEFRSGDDLFNFLRVYKNLANVITDENFKFEKNNTFMHVYFSLHPPVSNSYASIPYQIKFLLKFNPDLTQVNDEGKTAYELAAENYPSVAFNMLMDYMKSRQQQAKPLSRYNQFSPLFTRNQLRAQQKAYSVAKNYYEPDLGDLNSTFDLNKKIISFLPIKSQAALAKTSRKLRDLVYEHRHELAKSNPNVDKYDINAYISSYINTLRIYAGIKPEKKADLNTLLAYIEKSCIDKIHQKLENDPQGLGLFNEAYNTLCRLRDNS